MSTYFKTNNLENLPKAPGVYRFYDKTGELLYVGKAKVLKNRISSYFLGRDTRPTVVQMLKQIDKIEVVETDSEIEAVILEAELIRKLIPKYNIRLRDDKSFLMVKITKEDFPKIVFVRYKDYLEEVHSRHFREGGNQLIDRVDFRLRGNDRKVKGDWFGPYTSGYSLKKAFNVLKKIFQFADCSPNKYRSYVKKGQPCLYGVIKMCQAPCADLVSKEEYLKEINHLKMFLRGKKQSLLKIYQKEMATAAKEHRFEQAAEIRNKIFALQHLNQVASIKSDQDNPIDLNRIEAYDIANISGQLAVGSMVVWENGDLDKDEYRKFKIKTVDGSNDVAMIKEVVARRLRNDWPEPDLMIIDGGQGQFNAAKQALVEANLNYKLLSIAKGPDRKKDEFISDDPNIIKLLNQNNVLKNQILELRNEAHRFAQSYFHQRQLKKMIE